MNTLQISTREVLSTLLFYGYDHLQKLSPENAETFSISIQNHYSKRDAADLTLFKPKRFLELARKVLTRLGFCHDVISLTQKDTAQRVLRLRKEIERFSSFAFPTQGCRFLLRVDDFPSFSASSESFLSFHAVAHEYGIPYLLALTPYLHDGGLTAIEIDMLQKCRREGMTPALHGFTHKRVHPGISSEILGLPEGELRGALTNASSYLKRFSLDPKIFVAPFNSYDPQTIPAMTEHFPILCGGPESVRTLGYRGPSFINQSLYFPSYRGAYDLKRNLQWIMKVKTEGHGLLIPITLHWANELKDGFSNFRKLCQVIQPQIISWDDLLSIHTLINRTVSNHV